MPGSGPGFVVWPLSNFGFVVSQNSRNELQPPDNPILTPRNSDSIYSVGDQILS